MGDEALGKRGWGDGLGRKTLHVLNFVDSLPPDDLVVLVDAYDVVIMADPRRSVDAFYRGLARGLALEPADPAVVRDAPPPRDEGAALLEGLSLLRNGQRRAPEILFSGEIGCIDDLTGAAHAPGLGRRRFRCLNSGGYAGTASALGRFLRSVDWASELGNDQRGAYRMAAAARVNASLPLAVVDYNTEFFVTMYGVDFESEARWDPRLQRWHLADSPSTGPVAWHWPSYFKRMSAATAVLTGEAGVKTGSALRSVMIAAWVVGAIAAVLAAIVGAWCGGAVVWASARPDAPPAGSDGTRSAGKCWGGLLARARALGAELFSISRPSGPQPMNTIAAAAMPAVSKSAKGLGFKSSRSVAAHAVIRDMRSG